MAATIALSLVSHTNVGKTTLARTLLGRDVGEVRDAAHVTDTVDAHPLLATPEGDELTLWDTPGFGDSPRLLSRLRLHGHPLGWLLTQVWDRWRDRPLWAGQQVMRHVRDHSDVLLYLVDAADPPEQGAQVGAELELLAWTGKPVLVLLNQLGPPRAGDAEAHEVARWTEALRRWPQVRAVLALDAFARCWVQEAVLWRAVADALPPDRRGAMARLHGAWAAQRQRQFEQAMQVLAAALTEAAGWREPIADGPPTAGAGAALQRVGAAIGLARPDAAALADAQRRLAGRLQARMAEATVELLRLHAIDGHSEPLIAGRVVALAEARRKVDTGRAAWWGGLVSGAAAGLAADLASGGLTLGGGLIAGAVLGAVGGAGVAHGVNLVRGTDASHLTLGAEALQALLAEALLRYLAVAHFGRGRGAWAEAEASPHWAGAADAVLQDEGLALSPPLTQARVQALLVRCTRRLLERLYPDAWAASTNNPGG